MFKLKLVLLAFVVAMLAFACSVDPVAEPNETANQIQNVESTERMPLCICYKGCKLVVYDCEDPAPAGCSPIQSPSCNTVNPK